MAAEGTRNRFGLGPDEPTVTADPREGQRRAVADHCHREAGLPALNEPGGLLST